MLPKIFRTAESTTSPEPIIDERFRVDDQSPIGQGATGKVYRATDLQNGRQIALKILNTDVSSEWDSLVNLVHNYIVKVFERGYITDPDTGRRRPFIAMELLSGIGLDKRQMLHFHDVKEIVKILSHCGVALAYIHAQGRGHFDIKPSHIVVSLLKLEGPEEPNKGHLLSGVTILDFGLSGVISKAQQNLGAGTHAYMSPEQISKRPLDKSSDLFSLGIVAYEFLTNRHPFEDFVRLGTDELRLALDTVNPRFIIDLNSDVPDALAFAVHRAMAKDPTARPGATTFCRLLEIGKDYQDEVRAARKDVAQIRKKFGKGHMDAATASVALSEIELAGKMLRETVALRQQIDASLRKQSRELELDGRDEEPLGHAEERPAASPSSSALQPAIQDLASILTGNLATHAHEELKEAQGEVNVDPGEGQPPLSPGAPFAGPGQGRFDWWIQLSRSNWLRAVASMSVVLAIITAVAFLPTQDRSNEPPTFKSKYVNVTFEIQPEGATVEVDDERLGLDFMPILIGDHEIRIFKDGYETVNDTLHLANGSTMTYHRELRPYPLQLGIEDNFGTSTVELDGNALSESTRVLQDKNPHHIVIRTANLPDTALTFIYRRVELPQLSALAPGGVSIVAITSLKSEVVVYANSSGFRVRVGNAEVGIASREGLHLDELLGGASISVSKGPFRVSYRIEIDDPPILRLAVVPSSSSIQSSTMMLSANQNADSIFVDGELFQRRMQDGRLLISSLRLGPHTVRLMKEGFCVSPEAFNGRLTATAQLQAEFKFDPYASILFEGSPPSATIQVDGTKITGLTSGALAPGEHTVRVVAPGYNDFSTTLKVSCGANQSLSLASMVPAKPLSPATGKVVFTVNPNNAIVTLRADSNPQSARPVKSPIELVPGSYRLHASFPGYADVDHPFVLRSGEQSAIDLVLRRGTQPNVKSIPPSDSWTPALVVDKQGWQKAKNLSLLGEENAAGVYSFQIIKRGFVQSSFSSWIVGYRSATDYVEFRVSGKDLQWREKGGRWMEVGSIPTIRNADSIHVRVRIADGTVSTEVGTSLNALAAIGPAVAIQPGRFGITEGTEIFGLAH